MIRTDLNEALSSDSCEAVSTMLAFKIHQSWLGLALQAPEKLYCSHKMQLQLARMFCLQRCENQLQDQLLMTLSVETPAW